jgi:hypothetical protein
MVTKYFVYFIAIPTEEAPAARPDSRAYSTFGGAKNRSETQAEGWKPQLMTVVAESEEKIESVRQELVSNRIW